MELASMAGQSPGTLYSVPFVDRVSEIIQQGGPKGLEHNGEETIQSG
jgi:hypothetical protein